MAIKFKPLFKMTDIHKDIQRAIRAADKAMFDILKDAGDVFVNTARVRSEFTTRTGKLRSSIGCVVMKNGSTIYQNFVLDESGTDPGEGLKRGIEFAKDQGDGSGYILVVVAGMHYAAAVESKNYDVLTNSLPVGKSELFSGIRSLKKQLQK